MTCLPIPKEVAPIISISSERQPPYVLQLAWLHDSSTKTACTTMPSHPYALERDPKHLIIFSIIHHFSWMRLAIRPFRLSHLGQIQLVFKSAKQMNHVSIAITVHSVYEKHPFWELLSVTYVTNSTNSFSVATTKLLDLECVTACM